MRLARRYDGDPGLTGELLDFVSVLAHANRSLTANRRHSPCPPQLWVGENRAAVELISRENLSHLWGLIALTEWEMERSLEASAGHRTWRT